MVYLCSMYIGNNSADSVYYIKRDMTCFHRDYFTRVSRSTYFELVQFTTINVCVIDEYDCIMNYYNL